MPWGFQLLRWQAKSGHSSVDRCTVIRYCLGIKAEYIYVNDYLISVNIACVPDNIPTNTVSYVMHILLKLNRL